MLDEHAEAVKELAGHIEHLQAQKPTITAEVAAFEREVVAQCRYLMRLLADRRRSRYELAEALQRRDVTPELAEECLARIERAGLIDDLEFARSWISQRQRRRHRSATALAAELHSRGVSSDDITRAMRETAVADEAELCRDLVQRRLRSMGDLQHTDPRRVKRRLVDSLGRRGFSPGLAQRVVREELSR
ncbi:regulatory protein RecX [Devriesea agamarum]|uniref:regulatory protein RecX n=1 Tax=Devriesea agamarum TaxID=472569 RepID=UPI00083075B8|nr:regulatory protein RecX [Devriesea agamarum]